MNAEEYLAALNDEQRAAVVHTGSPLLILAGAGSGKTRVITTKIAYMISELDVAPSSILAVTFTRKAADEMRTRAAALDERAARSQIRTFHSFGAWFLRTYGEDSDLALQSNFTVYDEDDSASLLLSAVPGLARRDAASYVSRISLAKDYCLLPGDPALEGFSRLPNFAEYYKKYQERLEKTGNVDFGDLILLPYLILRGDELIRDTVQSRFRVILVDEYQDTNVAQFKLLKALAGPGAYVCVVGDDDQSIYKFRGAEVQNILNFQKEFPGTTVIRLEKNYRSTQEILSCAQSVVEHNEGRLGKALRSVRGAGKRPTLVYLPTQDDETALCANLIEQSHARGVPYASWAILYRTNAQSMGFESLFLRERIPYEIVGSLRFYEREEVKDALAWLSFIVNPRDEVSFRRIVNKPARGIGNTTQAKVIAASRGTSVLDGLADVKLSAKVRLALESFKATADALSASLAAPPAGSAPAGTAGADDPLASALPGGGEARLSNFVQSVIEKSGLAVYHKQQDERDDTQKIENLEELINSAVLYPLSRQGLIDFLDHVNLDRTLERQTGGESSSDRVTLITLHNTKGLEFKRVIITGLEWGVFPREDKTADELEEERRLFYVGITRAQDELYLTSCSLRRLYGSTRYMQPSPFLAELGDGVRVLGKRADEAPSIESRYRRGAQVYHDDWGSGVITKGYFSDGEYVVVVQFFSGTVKRFLPKYQQSALIIES